MRLSRFFPVRVGSEVDRRAHHVRWLAAERGQCREYPLQADPRLAECVAWAQRSAVRTGGGGAADRDDMAPPDGAAVACLLLPPVP